MNFKDDVTLDKNNLDIEWEKQSGIMEEYSTALAKSNKEYNDMKIDFDNIVATKKYEWRNSGFVAIDDKSTKVTEGALSDGIDVLFVDGKKELAQKQYEIDVLKGVVEALRNKKSALEYEVQLFMSGYYSTPKDQMSMFKNRQQDTKITAEGGR